MDMQHKLMGLIDSRGKQGIAARGTNIYPGGGKAAIKGMKAVHEGKKSYAKMAKKMIIMGGGK